MNCHPSQVATASSSPGFARNFTAARSAVRQGLVLTMCLTYGAPDDVGPATSWHDVGTDLCRLALLDEIEAVRGFDLTDDERESVRTVGDLFVLAGASPP